MELIKNKKTLALVLSFALLTITSDICYMLIDCSQYITKTIASSVFLIFGIINLIIVWNKPLFTKYRRFSIFITIGLLFAFLGDILLISNFVLGASLFAMGHVFYFISFLMLNKFNYIDLVCGAGIFVPSMALILLYPGFDFAGLEIVIYLYALIISFMLGKAISNLLQSPKSKKYLIILIGASLFFISDMMLLFYIFSGKTPVFDYLCLITYYPAEYLLALSILIHSNKTETHIQNEISE